MKGFLRFFIAICCICLSDFYPAAAAQQNKEKDAYILVIPSTSEPRIKYGADRLLTALKNAGYQARTVTNEKAVKNETRIIIGRVTDLSAKKGLPTVPAGKEAFAITSKNKKEIIIAGSDGSGVLYGCMELAGRIKTAGKVPQDISISDKPEMVLRGTCIGVQKPELLPGRGVYEYPYTEANFPWFYDKALWIKYLDMMVENRYNSLYLWNGHPFASLVKLKDYPYAVEVDDVTFRKNEEMFRFLTEEAGKRGIWVIQGFYNIIVSKPFAEKNKLKTQDRNRPIVPVIADYTRKSIAAFVQKYPNVGLLITLGEAMEGVGQDDVDWFTKTIIPGVQDGMKALGLKTEPPIILRAHDTDAPRVMKAALPLYKNLYTMAKYNGEALTTYTPRGKWAELHRTLSRIGTVQVENVHILANLEPFRYGSPAFIRKCVQAMHSVYEANGLHLYPQASYWDWPYSADKVKGRLLEMDRDRLWYDAWAHYSWNCHRAENEEINYWKDYFAREFGAGDQGGKDILEAYDESGEIAPKLLRRYGITDGNRQTLTLGMLMTQLVNPERYNLFTLMYESEAPEGEMIGEYAEKEWKGIPHKGETPVQVADEVIEHGRKAVEAIERATGTVSANKEEFGRLKNDMLCYNELAGFYSDKVRAALLSLRYKYSHDVDDLIKAVPLLESSLQHYRNLVNLTKDTYLYANSMQTKQRKIPVRGVDGTYKTWQEVLPLYENELIHFKRSVDSLRSKRTGGESQNASALKNADVKILSSGWRRFTVAHGEQVFSDTTITIKDFAGELAGLKGLAYKKHEQEKQGTILRFSSAAPVKVLIGFIQGQNGSFLPPPDLEHDASANDYGQSEIKIANAVTFDGMPGINIHSYSFGAGTHTLTLAKGACVLLGFISEDQPLKIYDAGIGVPAEKRNIDWLFE